MPRAASSSFSRCSVRCDAGIGGLGIMDAGSDASLVLIGDTIGLAITAILMTAAIAVGLSLALSAPFVISTSQSTKPAGTAP